MRIALIGTGNVAWHLAKACTAAGHQLVAVVGRTMPSAEAFAQQYTGAAASTSEALRSADIDVVLVSVPDAALADIAAKLEVKPNTLVAHTSGSQPVNVLKSVAGALPGVFYPVQTFTKYKPVDFSHIPVLVEGQDEKAEQILIQLGRSISQNVQVKDSIARKQLHLAAVFACNFTNHLFGISQSILQDAELPANLLQPLIQETVAKAGANNPFAVQTGPAARNDWNVIQEHNNMLEDNPFWQELYQKLTQSIQRQHTKLSNSNDNTNS